MRAERADVAYDEPQRAPFAPWPTSAPMRLTLAMLGLTLDVSLEPTATEAAEDEAPTNQGDTGGTWVGFAVHTTPEDIPLPQRTPPWDDEE